MAIVVEDGTGLSDADSYTSEAEADAYFSIMPSASTTAWDALDSTGKENYLKWATRVLDAKTDWEGYKYVETSALRWPRGGVCDRDNIAIAVTAVPDEVKHATAELARILLGEDITTGQDVTNLKSVIVDVVEIHYQDDTAQQRVPQFINSILNGVGFFNAGRRQAVPITRT